MSTNPPQTSQQIASAAIDAIAIYLEAGNRDKAMLSLNLAAPHISSYFGESVYNDLYTQIFAIDTNAFL